MSLLINLLMFVLILLCLFLGLLILVQLPKKEAGLGQAFGGATTEALFGAGSGTALTKMTKYSAGGFLVLCVFLAFLNAQSVKNRNAGVLEALKTAQTTPAAAPAVLPATRPTILPTNALKAEAPVVTNAVKTVPAK